MVRWPLLQRGQQESAVGSTIERNCAASSFDDGQCIKSPLGDKDRFIAGCVESLTVKQIRRGPLVVQRPIGRLCMRVNGSCNVMETIRRDNDTRTIAVTSCRICTGIEAKAARRCCLDTDSPPRQEGNSGRVMQSDTAFREVNGRPENPHGT